MEYTKLQIGCLLIVLYVSFIYFRERYAYKIKKREKIFEGLLNIGIISIGLDAVTAYTVNHLEQVPKLVNNVLHMLFLCSLDIIVFFMFIYIIDITRGIPKQRKKRFWYSVPLIFNIIIVVCFMSRLEYHKGNITNYSVGLAANTCYIMVAIYMLATVITIFMSWKSIGRHKLITISTYMLASICVTIYQMLYPQALITSLVPTFAIIGTYLNIENPVFTRLNDYNKEMVMGFATLVENRDDSTGGHIKRTTEYVKMLAEELRERGYYKKELTKDYIKNLVIAAPMHDVGKIAIPDSILQKPAKLTDEEYEIMKTHSARGGKIIQETFGHMGDDEYVKIAYEVARYHHEKWNGKGYPDKLEGKEIPLGARIMAVADVFDAVSAKRCYRDAMPLEKCFNIIESGSGQDFEPILVEVFLDMRSRIEEIYEKSNVLEQE